MPTKITKAIFPVAGLGTRFLPATKSGPKEMLPIVDKPLLQYAVEEAIASGIKEMIFVTGQWEHIVKHHFERCHAIEYELAIRNDLDLLAAIQNIKPSHIQYHYVHQPIANGLGQAVLCAKKIVRHSPFVVMLVDDLIYGKTPVLQQMLKIFQKNECSIIAVEEIPKEEISSYGILNVKSKKGRLIEFDDVIEKPKIEDAPSTLGIVGRYIFTNNIFNYLHRLKPGKNGEIQLTDGIQQLLQKERVLAYQYAGKRFDCGSKIGYLKATVEFAMQHPQIGKQFNLYLKNLKKELH